MVVPVTTTEDVSVCVVVAAAPVEPGTGSADSRPDVPEEAALDSEEVEEAVVVGWAVEVAVVVAWTDVVVGVLCTTEEEVVSRVTLDEAGVDELARVTVAAVEDDRAVVADVVRLVVTAVVVLPP